MAKLPACSCDAQKAFKTHSDLIKLIQFLMGLDDVYQPIRSSLLSRDPIPDLKTAFSIISREESHRGSSSSSSGNKPQVLVFATDKGWIIDSGSNQLGMAMGRGILRIVLTIPIPVSQPHPHPQNESEDDTNRLSFMEGTKRDASDDESLRN
ncbi:hypothetical protein Tco_0709325 [Tanacetum coccineum]